MLTHELSIATLPWICCSNSAEFPSLQNCCHEICRIRKSAEFWVCAQQICWLPSFCRFQVWFCRLQVWFCRLQSASMLEICRLKWMMSHWSCLSRYCCMSFWHTWLHIYYSSFSNIMLNNSTIQFSLSIDFILDKSINKPLICARCTSCVCVSIRWRLHP